MFQNGAGTTTQIGYVNRNDQRCEGHRGVDGTDHGALAEKEPRFFFLTIT
jgi:hypothetical protein